MSPTGCSVNSEMQVSYGSTTKFGGELEEQEVTSVWEMNCEQQPPDAQLHMPGEGMHQRLMSVSST
jgi:hypothetical protein